MVTTDPFVHLPVSLARSILSHWLGAKALSKLDVAYCNHKQRNTFLEILNDSELPDTHKILYTYIQADMDRLQWMALRNVKCSTFHIDIYDHVSWADQCLMFSFIQRSAGRLKSAHITAIPSLLGTLLPVVAAAKCSFVSFTLVIQYEMNDGDTADTTLQTPWDATLGQILANSRMELNKLQIIDYIDWQKHLADVSLPALRDATITICRDSDLISLCSAAPNITTLTTDTTCCTSAGIAAIGQHCRALESLSFWSDSQLSYVADLNTGIAAMATGCAKLQHISFEPCVNLTDIGLRAIATHCTQLQSLSFSQCNHVTDEGLAALQSLSATLLSLQLIECTGITGSGLVTVAKYCTLLHTLVLVDLMLNLIGPDELVEALPHMHNLTTLVLRYSVIDDEMLQQIAQHMPLLQHLDLGAENDNFDDNDYSSDDLLSLITKCEKLTYLELPPVMLQDVKQAFWLLESRPGLVVSGYSRLSTGV